LFKFVFGLELYVQVRNCEVVELVLFGRAS